MKINIIGWTVVVAFLSLAVGCTTIPVGKYDSLSNSSTNIYKTTSETYIRIEKLQRKFIVASAPSSKIDKNTFSPVFEGKSIDIAPELRFRENAIETLVKYTTVLDTLASKDYQKDVDKAATEFAGSLKNLSKPGSFKGADKVPGIAAGLVNIIGKQIVEHQRKDALKSVMTGSQNHIELLSKLVIESNDKIKKFVAHMEDSLISHANIARPKYDSADRYDFDLKIADTITEIEEINSALDTIESAMTQYPKAHAEIYALLDKKESKLDSLEILAMEAQRANKFYRSLNK